jgi:hypothetical protein
MSYLLAHRGGQTKLPEARGSGDAVGFWLRLQTAASLSRTRFATWAPSESGLGVLSARAGGSGGSRSLFFPKTENTDLSIVGNHYCVKPACRPR